MLFELMLDLTRCRWKQSCLNLGRVSYIFPRRFLCPYHSVVIVSTFLTSLLQLATPTRRDSISVLAKMAHRNNRRRARRPRSRASPTHNDHSSRHSLDQFIIPRPSLTSEVCATNLTQASSTSMPSPPTTIATSRHRSDIPAKLWQNRCTTRQDRDRAQREQAAKLEAQQIQLFGGEPGDDVELCFKMLEYFGGLDYIS
jgi:hypothetical protein